jgi:serine protease Do
MSGIQNHLIRFAIGLMFSLCGQILFAAPLSDPDALKLINQATFEVVVKKPTKDSLEYEKPLPFDLLPYAERNDKYIVIGTAFAIKPDLYVTAAHVMNLMYESQIDDYYLRDMEGNVHEVNMIKKYSQNKDFVIFTLKKPLAKAHYEINKQPAINNTVYAVGSALGEGIIIRDGLYTSNTPEEIAGEWKWIRFSAAASPGNSGGPLLDRNGKVIGIVLRKSANENLNFALPITVALNAKDNTATLEFRTRFGMDNMNFTTYGDIDDEVKLPMNYKKLNQALVKHYANYSRKLMTKFIKENEASIFPNGKQSSYVLYTTQTADFPHQINLGDDGFWYFYHPEEIKTSELGFNGYVRYGSMGSYDYLRLQRPDNISYKRFYSDSKMFMDLILQGWPITRTVGEEKVKVTSMGKAKEERLLKDKYGRVWQVRSWNIEFSDEVAVAYALPVPGGYSVMMKIANTAHIKNYMADMDYLTNFIHQSYYATLAQWDDFLKMDKLLPEAMHSINIDFAYNKYFKYKSDRLVFDYDPSTLNITKDSDLHLKFSFFKDEKDKGITWDVTGITLGDNKNNNIFFELERTAQPPEFLGDDYMKDWNNATQHNMPYNETAFYNDTQTYIATSLTGGNTSQKISRPFLYTVAYGVDGNRDAGKMKEKLDSFIKDVSVYEK